MDRNKKQKKRGGIKQKLRSEIDRLSKELSNQANPPAWNDSVSMHEKRSFHEAQLVQLINKNKNPSITYHQIKNLKKKIIPPLPTAIPEYKRQCPDDCEGPLDSPFCNYTCKHCTAACATSTGTA